MSKNKNLYAEILERHRPVDCLVIYPTDAIVIRARKSDFDDQRGSNPGKKKPITEFSAAARSNLSFTVRNTSMIFFSLITLTYPADFPADGRLVKSHLHKFLLWLKYQYRYVAYFWFLEFQRRGAPHFHIMTTVDLSVLDGGLKVGWRRRFNKWRKYYKNELFHSKVSASWNKIIFSTKDWSPAPQDRDKHLRVGCAVEQLLLRDAAIRYVAKHFSKRVQKEVPYEYRNVGRFWGCNRSVKEAIQPHGVIFTSSKNLEEQLRSLNWFGMDFYEQLGYFPRVLFGVSQLVHENPDHFGFPDHIDYQAWLDDFLSYEQGMDYE